VARKRLKIKVKVVLKSGVFMRVKEEGQYPLNIIVTTQEYNSHHKSIMSGGSSRWVSIALYIWRNTELMFSTF